ncbi:GNAT family N-acetyltransferase [Fulvivirgaceae bacterium BMA12]|uniref:GNAT family N-acetyltransferase n=1 Tax=Agaribacillus aureus TaxID=3051825 RepID=A0ABT8L6P4_9BACT|nr:GNAT family N-acetyltransferase [Fulvivirgaceae bacterium BMA12]
MSLIEIRHVENSDFEEIYEFICALENETFEKEQQRQILAQNLANANNVYLIALFEGEAVGFLSCHVQNLLHHNGLVGEIQEMFTKAEKRGLGIGRKLVDNLKAIARDRNFIQLEVTSNIARAFAHGFYEKQHFRNTHKKFVYKLSE